MTDIYAAVLRASRWFTSRCLNPRGLEQRLWQVLRQVRHSHGQDDIVSSQIVTALVVNRGRVIVTLTVPPARAEAEEPLRQQVEQVLRAISGVHSVMAILTADKSPSDESLHSLRDKSSGEMDPPKPNHLDKGFPSLLPSSHRPIRGPSRYNPAEPAAAKTGPDATDAVNTDAVNTGLAQVKFVIATASGKGGVGKSTIAVNLALALHERGIRVGLLDADIYGPSTPMLLNLPALAIRSAPLSPVESYGLKVMSMGLLVALDTPMIWRGPMVQGALRQMLFETNWGELDVMIVDLPPGTGDAQLTIAQRVPLSGAVIISTPQELALQDVRRGVNMFRRVKVPLLGLIENMSYFCCPHCGNESAIFKRGSGLHESERLGIDFLGAIPLDSELCESSDSGRPPMISRPDGQLAWYFRKLAERVWSKIENKRESVEDGGIECADIG